jgi:hypothetical protein
MSRYVERNEDMSPRGRLRVIIQDDGDAIVSVVSDPDELRFMPSAEFCTHAGGGRSKHTREAIYALFLAMERDNKERPLLTKNEEPAEPLRESAIASLTSQRDALLAACEALRPSSRGPGCWCPDYHGTQRVGHHAACILTRAAVAAATAKEHSDAIS